MRVTTGTGTYYRYFIAIKPIQVLYTDTECDDYFLKSNYTGT
jgi:hypothetical protein